MVIEFFLAILAAVTTTTAGGIALAATLAAGLFGWASFLIAVAHEV